MVQTVLQVVMVKIKTLQAGNNGFTPLKRNPRNCETFGFLRYGAKKYMEYFSKLILYISRPIKKNISDESSFQTGFAPLEKDLLKGWTKKYFLMGFTLLEIIIVLLIAGLAVSVITFSAARLYEKTLFNEEARRLLNTIKHAREISLIERKNIEFKIDEEEKKYWIDHGDDISTNLHSIPSEFTITGEAVIFFPKGNSSGGLIKINNGKGQEYKIEVENISGIPTIKRL